MSFLSGKQASGGNIMANNILYGKGAARSSADSRVAGRALQMEPYGGCLFRAAGWMSGVQPRLSGGVAFPGWASEVLPFHFSWTRAVDHLSRCSCWPP
jgi:hypothetical protein